MFEHKESIFQGVHLLILSNILVGCNLKQGDGRATGGEREVGIFSTKEECIEVVLEKFPQANGLTFGNCKDDGKCKCYAEIGMNGRYAKSDWAPKNQWMHGIWKSCFFVAGILKDY